MNSQTKHFLIHTDGAARGNPGPAGAAAILYDTSNVLHHFPEDRYVGAALQLFASVALMFWYVLRLFMSSRD